MSKNHLRLSVEVEAEQKWSQPFYHKNWATQFMISMVACSTLWARIFQLSHIKNNPSSGFGIKGYL